MIIKRLRSADRRTPNCKVRGQKIFYIFLIEIFLLLSFSVSTSYLVSEMNDNLVDAEELKNCCVTSNDGQKCQDVFSGDTSKCENPLPLPCDKLDECQLGCCYDEETGSCSKRTNKQNCIDSGGIWENGEKCNTLPECNVGCCILKENSKLSTEIECENDALDLGIEKNFKVGLNEIQCLQETGSQKQGACVYEDNKCKRTLENECNDLEVPFMKIICVRMKN